MNFRAAFSIALFLTLIVAQGESLDLTEVAGSTGVDVVKACLQRLSLAGTFSNDFNFLERIALVESNFGSQLNVPSQGIWKITPEIYAELVSISNLRLDLAAHIAATALVIGVDNVDLTNNDFSSPIRSAFAARLYIELRLGASASVPATLEQQSAWWVDNYNAEGTDFISLVQTYEDQTRCTIYKLDIWLIVDGSGSIGPNHFADTLVFVRELARSFEIAPEKVRMGFTVYSSEVYPISNFDEHTNNLGFETAVNETSYPKGGTKTGKAIQEVVDSGFQVSEGMRPIGEAVPRILVVLTDGESQDEVQEPSDAARDKGITVYAVGVGEGFKKDELNEIGNDPDGQHVYGLSDFNELVSVLRKSLEDKACTAPAPIQDLTPVSVTIEVGQIYYSSVIVQSNGLCTLTYEVTSIVSTGRVYISTNLENPNSAAYDFYFDIQVGITEIVLQATNAEQTAFEYLGQNFNPLALNRRKRQASNNSTTVLYTAVQSTGTDPLELKIETNRQVTLRGGAIKVILTATNLMLFAFLACFALL